MPDDKDQSNNGDLEAIALNGVHHSKKLDDIHIASEAHIVEQHKTTNAVQSLEPVLEAIALTLHKILQILEAQSPPSAP